MRTPSPSKNQRQFSDDAYSPNDIGEATPRPDGFARSAYPIPNLSYVEALANEHIEYGDDLQARSPTRSHTQSQSSNPSASPKKITSLWNVGNGVTFTHLANTIASKREQPRWKRTCAAGEAGRSGPPSFQHSSFSVADWRRFAFELDRASPHQNGTPASAGSFF
ncbi:hypothetical protein PMIN01_11729 [Paraphaeosphaeria minitans]|uniref:Uncharacterized protein n=1 Tax=Paraphaeosphaeria minitans TaxID=565426 RepID=A0A9P6G722_9PLEO|nr:hypothetical protein PMIN01_11729 [Paraphaeosphaeria minitans]